MSKYRSLLPLRKFVFGIYSSFQPCTLCIFFAILWASRNANQLYRAHRWLAFVSMRMRARLKSKPFVNPEETFSPIWLTQTFTERLTNEAQRKRFYGNVIILNKYLSVKITLHSVGLFFSIKTPQEVRFCLVSHRNRNKTEFKIQNDQMHSS